MDIQFDLSGIEGIDEYLNQSVEKLLEGARVGANKALMKMEADAKAFIDSNNSIDKGQLKESVHAETADINGLTVEGEISSGGNVMGTNVEHAVFIEFGTGQRGIKSPSPPKSPDDVHHREDWVGMPAQPFMYPTYVKAQEESPKLIAEAIMDKMKE